MKHQEMIEAPTKALGSASENARTELGGTSHSAQFIAARDSRNRRISGLAVRNGRYYAVLWADRGDGRKGARRFPLIDEHGEPIRTVAGAKAALEEFRAVRRANRLPNAGRKPSVESFASEYSQMATTQAKQPATRSKETDALARWRSHLGELRIDRITTPMLKSYVEARLRGCHLGGRKYSAASPRTVSLDVIALRNLLKAAAEAGHLRELPRFPKIQIPPAPRRPLLTPHEFDRLVNSCTAAKPDGEPVTKNGEQLRDFLRLLAYSGAREQEALRLRWSHVDFDGGRLFLGAPEHFTAAAATIGTGGETKNRASRIVDFNDQLGSLLREMHDRRAPDSAFLFPSPQRGTRDVHAKTFRESLKLARTHAKLPRVGFHDLRHLFCSFAVMAGIDFMTIAAWLGHKDGGILVGKVYGHLLDEHRRKMAAKLVIGLQGAASDQRRKMDA